MIEVTSTFAQTIVVERNALSILPHDVLVHLVDLIGKAAEAASNRVIFDKFQRSCWFVNHIVRSKNQTMNVLYGLTSQFLLSKCLAHIEQAQHEFVVLSEVR